MQPNLWIVKRKRIIFQSYSLLPTCLFISQCNICNIGGIFIHKSISEVGTRLSKIISEMFVVFVFWFGRRGKKRAVLNTISYIRLVPMREILTEGAPDCNVGTKWIFHLSRDKIETTMIEDWLQIRETLDAIPGRGVQLNWERPQLLPPHRHPLGLARTHACPSQVKKKLKTQNKTIKNTTLVWTNNTKQMKHWQVKNLCSAISWIVSMWRVVSWGTNLQALR